ncbi:MAG: hypothetical protein WBA35_10645, partial [Litorimonas sp.]
MFRMTVAAFVLYSIATIASARDFHVDPAVGATPPQEDGSVQAPFSSAARALSSGAVSGGDRILLADGSHGTITVVNAFFDPPVEIVAQNLGEAHADRILVKGGEGLRFRGLSVWPSVGGGTPGNLVSADKNAKDIWFDGMDIRGREDAPDTYMGWSKENWLALQSNGVRLD